MAGRPYAVKSLMSPLEKTERPADRVVADDGWRAVAFQVHDAETMCVGVWSETARRAVVLPRLINLGVGQTAAERQRDYKNEGAHVTGIRR